MLVEVYSRQERQTCVKKAAQQKYCALVLHGVTPKRSSGLILNPIMARLNSVKNINFGLDHEIIFFEILKNCILGH